MMKKYIALAAAAILCSITKAEASQLCLPTSFLSSGCSQSANLSLSANDTKAFDTTNTKVYLLQVVSGTVTAISNGPSGAIDAVGTDYSGNNTQTFTAGLYYFILNGQTSLTLKATSDANINYASITDLDFKTNNIATISNTLSSLDMFAKGLGQQINSSQLNYITRASIGIPDGVAGLDTNGYLTNALNTTEDSVLGGSVNLGTFKSISVLPNSISSSTTLPSTPLVSTGSDWEDDAYNSPNIFMIGGHTAFQEGHLSVYGAPASYSDEGVLLNLEMGNDQWSSMRAGSGDFDAIGEFIHASNTTPYYKVGQDFTDDTGTTHTVVFDAGGATVKPALPASWVAMYAARMRGPGLLVVTNVIANPATTVASIPGFTGQTVPDLWTGYITGYTAVDGGTHLDMAAGWHPYSSWVGAWGTNNNVTPDPTSTGLDQTFYSAYTHPILIIGTYMQAFDSNLMCADSYDASGSFDPTKTLTRNDALVQSCKGTEYDIETPANMPNGWMHSIGVSVGMSTTPLPSADSVGFVAQGNWPTAYSSGLGTDGRDFQGGNLAVNSRRGPEGTIGDSNELMESEQGSDAPTDVRSNMIGLHVIQRTDTVGYDNSSGYHNPADQSLHIGEWYGGPQFGTSGDSSTRDYGNYMADLVINPGWSKGGLALCGKSNGFAISDSSCVTVNSVGQFLVSPSDNTTGVSLNIDPSGYVGGSAGSAAIAIGTMPSGSATAFGAYLPSTYGNDLEEYVVGSNNIRSLSASGNESLAGSLNAKGDIISSGKLSMVSGIFGVSSSGDNLAQIYITSAGDWTIGTSVSGGGNIRGVNTYYGTGVNVTTVQATNGNFGNFDLTGNGFIESGNALYLKPSTLDGNLQPAFQGIDSYTIATTANMSANIGFLASSIQAAANGTGGFKSAARSELDPDGYGNWVVSNTGANVSSGTGGAIRTASYTKSSLPTTNETDGNTLWCSDCKVNSITGVAVFWHSSASKWTDSQNNDLSN